MSLLGQKLAPPPSEPADVRSQILVDEIERPRVGPMRDIVATIQPEQDEIVRSDVGTTVCVQGAPGTGKTAVGLHRAAWLLYAFREKLSRAGVLAPLCHLVRTDAARRSGRRRHAPVSEPERPSA